MLIERDTKSGIRDLQRGTALTNRMNFWRWKKNLPTWHLRRPRKATNTEGTIPSGGSNEGESITVSVPDSTIQSMQGLDDLGSENVEWDDFVDLENPNEDE